MRYPQAYDELLQKWPVAHETSIVATHAGSTHVIASGAPHAPPVILLHGMNATALVWRSNVAELSRHFRVYAPDIPGQRGKSSSAIRLRNRAHYAAWLSELLDALNISKAALVGNSYGGFLAMNQALLTPQRVSGVVLINPAGVFVSVLPLGLPWLWQQVKRVLSFKRERKPVDLAQYLGRNVSLRPDEREWADLISLPAKSGEQGRNMAFPVVFTTAELRAIRVPVMLLMGDNDLLYDPVATAEKAKQRMPSLDVRMLHGAHHIAAMAKPAEANAHIIQFLQTRANY